jgi:hypothetical protein
VIEKRKLLAILGALLTLGPVSPLGAQKAPSKAGDGSLLIANAAIGGLTAGIYRVIAKKPLPGGIVRGVIAGAAVFGGKRLIGEGRPGYWWAGRQLTSVASSEVLNAGYGRPVLAHTVLPVGPIRIHVDRLSKRKITPRLDLVSSVAAVVMATSNGSRLAWRETLATSAITFIARETSDQLGNATAGAIAFSELAPDGKFVDLESKRSILSHEMTHVAQYDFTFNAVSDPVRASIESKSPWLKRYSRYVDVNLILPVGMLANSLLSYESRPWEREAVSIAAHAP